MRKRVVFLSAFGDNLGGTERWTNDMASSLHGRGYNVQWASLFPSPRPHRYERPEEIRTRHFYSFAPGRLWHFAQHKPVARLATFLRSLPNGTVLICTDTWMMRHVLATRLPVGLGTSLPLIGQHHFMFPTSSRGLRILRRVYTNANAVVFLSGADRERAIEEGFANAVSIANPVEAAPLTLSSKDRSKVVVAIGRLAPQKSFGHAIRAWGSVIKDHPEWQLHIYGSGPQERQLRKLIRSHALEGKVSLRGSTDRPLEVLADAAIHLSSSQYEGFPLSILEAASVGVPTIAYNCAPGIVEQLDGGRAGLLVTPNDEAALAQAINSLIHDPAARAQYGTRALERSRLYGPDRITDQWERLIESMT